MNGWPSGSAHLVIRHTGQVFPLPRTPLTIGRGEDNTIVLADPEASDQHLMIYRQGAQFVVQDMGSAHGTYLDNRRIAGPQPLRDGAVLRAGNTLFDVRIPAAAGEVAQPAAPFAPAAGPSGRSRVGIILALLLGVIAVAVLIIAAILLLGRRSGEPSVRIESPAEGTELIVGQELILRATADGAPDILDMDLLVDDVVVGTTTSPDPAGSDSLTVSVPWTFAQPGSHSISAVAYTAGGEVGESTSVDVLVAEEAAQVTPSATPTTSETTTETPTPEPTVPGATATLTPTLTETPTLTPTPTPTSTPVPLPQIASFLANPAIIIAGDCTTLEWGAVSYATEVTIDQGIGGVATPGSTTVCPASTTSYVMTATGPSGITSATTTVTVQPGSPDLTVENIEFVPMPPVQGSDNEVRITMRNSGTAAAGAFNWEWQPGTATPYGGSLPGLNPGQSQVVTVVWNPASWYGNLPTRARVDIGGAVEESDETNNERQVNVQVVPAPDVTVSLGSQAPLDGFQANNGGGNTGADIRMGNGAFFGSPPSELVTRGFMSFDLSGIPAGATIKSIELRFYQAQVNGSPYTKLGNPLLKHLDYGPSLEAGDFDAPALASAILSPHPSAGQWYVVTSGLVANWLQGDLDAGRTRFQVRLEFGSETDGDGDQDNAYFESADNSLGTGNVPRLTITYAP